MIHSIIAEPQLKVSTATCVKSGGFNASFFDELYPLYDGARFAPATPSLTKLGLGLVLDQLVMHRSAF